MVTSKKLKIDLKNKQPFKEYFTDCVKMAKENSQTKTNLRNFLHKREFYENSYELKTPSHKVFQQAYKNCSELKDKIKHLDTSVQQIKELTARYQSFLALQECIQNDYLPKRIKLQMIQEMKWRCNAMSLGQDPEQDYLSVLLRQLSDLNEYVQELNNNISSKLHNSSDDSNTKYIKGKELAKLLNKSVRTIGNWCRNNKVTYRMVDGNGGKHYEILISSLKEEIKQQVLPFI